VCVCVCMFVYASSALERSNISVIQNVLREHS